MASLDFTNEATTVIRFQTDGDFYHFREAVEDRYDGRMVRVRRSKVSLTKGTYAEVYHSRGLGAELKGLAYGQFSGHTISTTYEKEN
jgi:hypothetical protein